MPTSTSRNANRTPLMTSMSSKQKMLMQSLTHFFTRSPHTRTFGGVRADGTPHNPYMAGFLQHVSKGAPISLRVIDWFVTNYSREHDVSYVVSRTQQRFNVHESYKVQLRSYSKRQFDPFCRRNRINFFYAEDKKVETTVGQLAFFRWALENEVLRYVQAHLKEIEKEMRQYVRAQREEKKEHQKCGKTSPPGEGEPGMGGGANGGSGKVGGSAGRSKTRRRTAGSGTIAIGAEASIKKGFIHTHRAPVTVSFA